MRIIFLGTPEFAAPSLQALIEAGHEIAAVFTQPDRPKGRGNQFAASPVKEAALRLGLTVLQPDRVRRPEHVATIAALEPSLMVVVGYGQIIPQSIIDIPPHGVLNVHASLLPKYRGAAPIQWAIAKGETETGVTIMRIDAGLDTGDMLLKWSTAIYPDETASELSRRLAPAGAKLLIDAIKQIESGTARFEPQDAAQATYAPILKKEDGRVDWSRSATEIYNRLRGFAPWPGSYTTLRGQTLQIYKARPIEAAAEGEPGTLHVEKRRLLVTCGAGSLEVLELQMEGRKRMPIDTFLNGYSLKPDKRLGGSG
ncbi:MAG: methionyl-tRNA formyltransferase [Bryobacteraceae bacterium]